MSRRRLVAHRSCSVVVLLSFAIPAFAGEPSFYGPQPAAETIDLTMYVRIRQEGFLHSHVMQFAGALVDGIGPRLTGSPNMAKANRWTRDTLTAIGLQNAHLEDWGEFGIGWQQRNTSIRMVSPDPKPLVAQAAPWSPATRGPISAEVVYMDIHDLTDLETYRGKLHGKIVLLGPTRSTPDLTEPLFHRYTQKELAELETYPDPIPGPGVQAALEERRKRTQVREAALKLLTSEGAAAVITPSPDSHDGGGTGILFDDNGANLVRSAQTRDNAVTIPSAVMMIEHYNRLARLIENHVPVNLEVDIQTSVTGDHEHGFNTIAEIPGTDPG